MSVIKFELKEDHFKLLKHLSWKELTKGKEITTDGTNSPFGGLDYYEDMGIILFGQPEGFNPEIHDGGDGDPFEWSKEQKEEMDELIKELPVALEIILSTGSFELGRYKCRYHIREWKKLK
jgi:hypothetical protein